MKKILSKLLIIVLLSLNFSGISFAQSDKTILNNAISSSFLSENFQMDFEGGISFGDSGVYFNGFQNHEKEKLNEKTRIDINVDSNDFLTLGGAEFSKFNLDLGAYFDSYFDFNTLDLFFNFSDVTADVETEDENLKNIIEGSVEVTKIFSDKYYYLSLSDILDFYKTSGIISKDEIQSLESYFVKTGKKNSIDFFKVLIDADVFEIEKRGSKEYKMTLNKNISDIDFLKIIGFLEKDDLTKDFAKELKEKLIILSDEEIKEMQIIYSSFSGFFDYGMIFKLDNFGKIENIETEIDVFVKEFAGNDILINFEIDFSYNDIKIIFPEKDSSQVVDFSKIFKMIKSLDSFNPYSSYDYEEEYDSYSANNYNVGKYWYSESLRRFNSDGFSFDSGMIGDEITKGSFYFFLNKVKKLYLGKGLKNGFSQGEKINKLLGTSVIIKEFFPEVKRPIKWGMDNGLLPKTFSPLKAKSKNMTDVEFLFILYRVVDYKLGE